MSQVARSTSIETRKCFAFRDFFLFSPGVSESDASLFLWKVASITHGLNSFRPRGLFGLCVDVKNAGFANNEGFGLVAHTVFLEGMYCVEIGIDIDMELPPGLSLPSLPNNPRCG